METEEVIVLRKMASESWLKLLRRTAKSKGELPLPSLVKKEAKLPGLEFGLPR